MSQMDQELLFREVRGMAALPPITDIRLMGRHVRETCTIPDIGTNFLDERSYPDDVPVPSFGLRLRCERCGYAGALRVDHGVSANRSHMLTG